MLLTAQQGRNSARERGRGGAVTSKGRPTVVREGAHILLLTTGSHDRQGSTHPVTHLRTSRLLPRTCRRFTAKRVPDSPSARAHGAASSPDERKKARKLSALAGADRCHRLKG
ncbi:hypothetical protein SKAU_G00353060 [Synaphobranchus kaupii]|uniref:Uncharacterized protein n=1 Tax=Synaphobranchus kaupii TaxID=118154 RepID=A0A9Q1EKW4_SYNKA|nr:hypothetical protein SKAU_G00353060 [Synaphobranchus kaupii]